MRVVINRLSFTHAVAMFCGALFSSFALAQPSLSIDEMVAYVLANNPGFSQDRAAIAAKQEYIRSEQRKSWPALKGELTVLHGEGEPTSFAAIQGRTDPETPTTEYMSGNYGVGKVTLSTPLFQEGTFFFQKTPAQRMAEENLNQAQSVADYHVVEQSNDVATAYLNALSAGEQLALLKSSFVKEQQRLDAIQKRVRAGLATHSDELSVKAVLSEKFAGVNAAERLNAYHHMLIAFAMGRSPNTQTVLIPVPMDFPKADVIDNVLRAMLETHPELRSKMATFKVTESTLASQRAEYLPEVTFDISHTEAGDFYTKGTNSFDSVGVTLKMTFAGENFSRSQARSYEVEESKQIVIQTRTKLTQDIYQAYYAYLNAVDLYDASKDTVAKAVADEQESIAKHAKGMVSMDALLHDETNALQSRVNQVKLRYAAWIAWADYIKAVGRPYSSSLATVNP